MPPYDPLDEPPPIPRFAISRSARLKPTRPRFHVPFRPGTTRTILPGLAVLAVLGIQAWTLHALSRTRAELAIATGDLDETNGSLGRLREVTVSQDSQQIGRLDGLADSIRSVLEYAQGGVRLWEAAYAAQEKRLDEHAAGLAGHDRAIATVTNATRSASTRLDELDRADVAYASRVDALERQSRTHGAAVQTLVDRADAREADLVAVTTAVGSIRESLAGLDTQLGGLKDQLTSTGSAFGEMDTRIARLDGWIDGFRRAGLNGDAVQNRLAALASELRRVSLRIDSLRSSAPVISEPDR